MRTKQYENNNTANATVAAVNTKVNTVNANVNANTNINAGATHVASHTNNAQAIKDSIFLSKIDIDSKIRKFLISSNIEHLIYDEYYDLDAEEETVGIPNDNYQTYIVYASNGVFEVSENRFMKVSSRLAGDENYNFTQLKPYKEYIDFKIPKIPQKLIDTLMEMDRAVYQKVKGEFYAAICWNFKDNKYYIRIPKQEVSGAAVHFDKIVDTDDEIMVLDHHSHNTMGAFYSGADDSDDKLAKLKISAVFGKIFDQSPSIACRIIMNGRANSINIRDIIESDVNVDEIKNIVDKLFKDKVVSEKVYHYRNSWGYAGNVNKNQGQNKPKQGQLFPNEFSYNEIYDNFGNPIGIDDYNLDLELVDDSAENLNKLQSNLAHYTFDVKDGDYKFYINDALFEGSELYEDLDMMYDCILNYTYNPEFNVKSILRIILNSIKNKWGDKITSYSAIKYLINNECYTYFDSKIIEAVIECTDIKSYNVYSKALLTEQFYEVLELLESLNEYMNDLMDLPEVLKDIESYNKFTEFKFDQFAKHVILNTTLGNDILKKININ